MIYAKTTAHPTVVMSFKFAHNVMDITKSTDIINTVTILVALLPPSNIFQNNWDFVKNAIKPPYYSKFTAIVKYKWLPYSLNTKLFLLQNRKGECISIGLIPLPCNTSRRLAEIISLDKFSDSCSVITRSLTEHLVTCVSGAI